MQCTKSRFWTDHESLESRRPLNIDDESHVGQNLQERHDDLELVCKKHKQHNLRSNAMSSHTLHVAQLHVKFGLCRSKSRTRFRSLSSSSLSAFLFTACVGPS